MHERPEGSPLGRPVLSVVLVTRNHQAYVRRCVRSVLDEDRAGVELVVVDDGSSDHTSDILDEAVAGDPRAHVHRLGSTSGTGPARDVALGLARGDYVWFVDAADYVVGAALVAIVRLLSDAAPDVLLVEALQRDLFGDERVGEPARSLPYILANKVVRREHLERLGAHFGPGAWAEVRVSAPAVLTAAKVDELGRPAYVRRQVPGPVRRTWSDGPTADVLAAYDDAFAAVDAGPRDDDRHAALLAGMLHHFRELLDQAGGERRRALFQGMASRVGAHRRPSDDAAVPAAERPLLSAMASGRYTAYRAVEARQRGGSATRRRARSLLRRFRKDRSRARNFVLRRYYARQLRRPMDDNLAVFAAYWYAAYSCNPRAIYEKARELVPWVDGVWVVNRDKLGVLPPGTRHVVAGTRDYYRLMARAKYFVNNVNFPNDIGKRPGQVHVQTHHGTPLKTMGMDLAGASFSRLGMNFPRLLRRVRRWDYSVSANAFTTEIWERVYPSGTYESLETGYPRNDALANATPEQAARLRAELGIEPGQTAVLYAPTFREYTRKYVPLLDLDRLTDRLGPDFVVLMRAHYFYGAKDRPAGSGRVVDVADHPSIEELCIASDVLVTDYSSLLFDYAVLDRPIVVFAPDWDVYRTIRGVYFDLMAEPPGAVTVDEDGLADVLRSRSAWDDANAAVRAVFRAKYCSLEDGRAAERVVQRVWPAPAGAAAVPAPTTRDETEAGHG